MGFFRTQVIGRINHNMNVLILIVGPTGIGKSWAGLRLAEMFDRTFTPRRICFRAKEFLRKLPDVPHGAFMVWDEPGQSVGHRTWLSPANMLIQFTLQSFRYKLVNVIFCLPNAYYLDKVPRELCHFMVNIVRRGVGDVYEIKKSQFADRMYTKYVGTVYLHPPSEALVEEYERMRAQLQEERYASYLEKLEYRERKEIEKMQPKGSIEELVEQAKDILPKVLNPESRGYRKKIDVQKMCRLLNISQYKGYQVRAALLDELEQQS